MVSILGKASKQEQILKTLLENKIPQNLDSVDIDIYKDGNLKKSLLNCNKIDFVGGQTKGNKKADLIVSNPNENFLISLKNTPFGAWQSADSLAGDDIDNIIIGILTRGKNTLRGSIFEEKDYNFKIKYDDRDKIFRILNRSNSTSQLIVKINNKSKEKVVFGSDILGNGAVIQIDQKNENLIEYSNNKLVLNVKEYIDGKDQLNDLDIVYKVTNIKGSRGKSRFPGIRVQAVPRSETAKNPIIAKFKGIDIII